MQRTGMPNANMRAWCQICDLEGKIQYSLPKERPFLTKGYFILLVKNHPYLTETQIAWFLPIKPCHGIHLDEKEFKTILNKLKQNMHTCTQDQKCSDFITYISKMLQKGTAWVCFPIRMMSSSWSQINRSQIWGKVYGLFLYLASIFMSVPPSPLFLLPSHIHTERHPYICEPPSQTQLIRSLIIFQIIMS